MLDVLRRKAGELGLRPQLYTADMRHFSLPHRFALIFIAFNGFVHNLTRGFPARSRERSVAKPQRGKGIMSGDSDFPFDPQPLSP